MVAYARDSLAALRRKGRRDAESRLAAYRAIEAERAARSAAAGYLAWRAGEPQPDSRLSVPFRA
jgi:hypothetical protein